MHISRLRVGLQCRETAQNFPDFLDSLLLTSRQDGPAYRLSAKTTSTAAGRRTVSVGLVDEVVLVEVVALSKFTTLTAAGVPTADVDELEVGELVAIVVVVAAVAVLRVVCVVADDCIGELVVTIAAAADTVSTIVAVAEYWPNVAFTGLDPAATAKWNVSLDGLEAVMAATGTETVFRSGRG